MIRVRISVLKAIMEAKELTQTELANAIGVDQSLVSKILKNKITSVGNKFIEGLMNYTGMSFDDLFFLSKNYGLRIPYNFHANPSDLPADVVSNPRKGKSSSRQKSSIPTGNKEAHENK